MKNLIISLLMTKVLADNVMVSCTGQELVGMVIAVLTIVTLIDMQWDKLRQQFEEKKEEVRKRWELEESSWIWPKK